jgi:hypothetical protein
MKKLFYAVILLQCAVFLQAQQVPRFVKNAVKKAPKNALVGVGNANLATLNMSRTVAATRARADISRQLNAVIKEMHLDYTAAGVDSNTVVTFQESISVTLSQSRLEGAQVFAEGKDGNDNYWVVVILKKTDTVQEVNQAVSAAKQEVPKMNSFLLSQDAESRMDRALDKVKAEESRRY